MLSQSVYKLFFAIVLVGMIGNGLFAQISEGGEPKSLTSVEVDESQVLVYLFDKPNIEELIEEDIQRDSQGENLRDAVAVPVALDITNSGTWFGLESGGRIWRMSIQVPEALSLEAYYNQFYIPEGGEFFVYNASGSEHFGAYTYLNNKESGRMSTEMIQGDLINFEYFEPEDKIGEGVISIQDVAFRYRDVIGVGPDDEVGGSQSCQVDVICNEGTDWENQINSVVRIRTRINGQFFWCSGTVMNNTQEDCRPLFLTALHCALDGDDMSNQEELDLYRFYFRFQASVCGNGNGYQGNTITGCTRLADSNDNGGASGSDFLLLEMSTGIPQTYSPYYAGWNASASTSIGGGVGIHHPAGDVKKISTYTLAPTSAPWGVNNTHWRVLWGATENGHGVTEGGSSGSPLFNGDGQVIGTLTGGASFCNDVQPGGQALPDFYGKMSHHWSNNPNPNDEKLKEYLDPSGLNTTLFLGSSEPCSPNSVSEYEVNRFELIPNPADGFVRIVSTDNAHIANIKLYNIIGTEVLSLSPNTSEFILDASTLDNGVFLMNLKFNDGTSSIERLVINH